MLSKSQVQEYRDKGYVIVDKFFDSKEVHAMQAELKRFRCTIDHWSVPKVA